MHYHLSQCGKSEHSEMKKYLLHANTLPKAGQACHSLLVNCYPELRHSLPPRFAFGNGQPQSRTAMPICREEQTENKVEKKKQ